MVTNRESGATYHFCTYFDRNYLSRGLALYMSLQEHCPGFKLWVLCMDSGAYEVLDGLGLAGVHLISLEEFERDDELLQGAKKNRSRIEYYFTCTPSLPLYILDRWPEVDLITYLDADLCFFASPAPLFVEMGTGSIAIIGHRFPPDLRDRERYGIYNVGWVSFRRDENAIACLHWWHERCIEWCYDRVENGRFADQKYLDDWPSRFRNVIVLEHIGANLAPWNVSSYCLRYAGGDTVMVDSRPLIFFHFHDLREVGQWLYDPNWTGYDVTPSVVLRRRVYAPYVRLLYAVNHQLLPTSGSTPLRGSARWWSKHNGQEGSWIQPLVRQFRILLSASRNVPSGRYMVAVAGHVIWPWW